MTQTKRAWIGFLVAPGAAGLLFYFFGLLMGYGDAAVVGPMLLAPLGYAAALVLGVPVYFAMQRWGIRSLLAYLLLGALIAVVCYVVYTLVMSYHGQAIVIFRNSARRTTTAVIYAVVASAVFWLIAIRPGRSAR